MWKGQPVAARKGLLSSEGQKASASCKRRPLTAHDMCIQTRDEGQVSFWSLGVVVKKAYLGHKAFSFINQKYNRAPDSSTCTFKYVSIFL